MTVTAAQCPKALQPPHPSAKQVGKAISPPPCEHGVPLYPLRYGIADKRYKDAVYPTLTTKGYPDLIGGKAYGLRVLRPGTYVYLCYFQSGRMWTKHYQVTPDIRFASIWWTQEDYDDLAPGRLSRPDTVGARPHLLAPADAKDGPVYLFVSDTVLTHATLWRIETNADGLRDKLATQVTPTGGIAQPHAFSGVLLTHATPELLLPTLNGVPTYYAWSEISPEKTYPDVTRVIGDLYVALLPRKDIVPLAVVLQDPLGVVSELNYLCSAEVKKRDDYQAQSKHKLHSAGLIDGYFKHAEASSRTPEARTALARQQALVDLKGARAFKPAYEEKVQTFQSMIQKAGADVVSWLRLVNATGLFGRALSLFDLDCARNAGDYEMAVLHCFGAAVHTDDGLKELARHIEASPGVSPIWRALGGGGKPLMMRLERPLTIAKGMFDAVDKVLDERPGTIVTDLLSRLLWPHLASAPVQIAEVQVRRLRHVAEQRFGIVIGRRMVTSQQYLSYSLELQGYLAFGPEVYARWPRGVPPLPESSRGYPTGTPPSANAEIWEWETIGTTTVTGQPKPMDPKGNPLLRNLKRMQGPAGAVFTGIGAGLAIWGMRNATGELRKDTYSVSNWTAFLGAGAALVGASIEATTLVVSTVVARRGKEALAYSVKVFGVKWGATVAGATAAGLLVVADLVRAANASSDANPEQARMYLYSALSGGLLAVATGAGGSATLATLAGGGEAVAVLGLTPAGWAVIAVLATGALFYFTVQSDEAQHNPVEIWLRHTAWGATAPRYTLAQELQAWHSLQYSPRISPKWESAGGIAGTLRLRCTMPAMAAQDDFQSDLRVTLRGKPLDRIDAASALSTPGTSVNVDTQYVIGPLTDGYGIERSWRIGMHKDAQVELKYFYQPDPQRLPEIGLEQPGAPAALVFTSSSLFSDSIGPEKLVPVRSPK
ncbi:toxin VasX [Achromobacter sp. NPDC058515]|uniref:toxin VasX n=1 Tax=Achromobacter sp. NPDC058515 TaxID=3346533 RepID=UPI003655EDB9